MHAGAVYAGAADSQRKAFQKKGKSISFHNYTLPSDTGGLLILDF